MVNEKYPKYEIPAKQRQCYHPRDQINDSGICCDCGAQTSIRPATMTLSKCPICGVSTGISLRENRSFIDSMCEPCFKDYQASPWISKSK